MEAKINLYHAWNPATAEDHWYFAYGSNMSVEQMKSQTGRNRQAIRSRLQGYCFTFNNRDKNGEIYANIVPDPAAELWGVVYLFDIERFAEWTSSRELRMAATGEFL